VSAHEVLGCHQAFSGEHDIAPTQMLDDGLQPGRLLPPGFVPSHRMFPGSHHEFGGFAQ
jgi:hypothetical protein